ncbi:PD-(D/E)XK motif protein [Pseudomonas luteola]|uniref:PD-(D/E)XK motif protein n=1 Tax=Pseudomonas luteola TaxID=47886 RepID=UPI00289EF9C9|nr:PD-(D/E)XK motif protein [Pseudomonas luteola]
MARQTNDFVAAWEALSGSDAAGGWRGIPVTPAGSCELLAARRFPGNEEALLACFPSARLASAERLPEGKGFEIVRADPKGDGKTWIALSRKESGNPELFAEMVSDVAGAMDAEAHNGEEQVLKSMLRRVRMWQNFMSRGTQPLGPEAELGLAGELTFIACLLQAGVSAETILEGWVGPEDAPKDFVLGHGAIEIKTTLSTAGFPVKIGSLEQLDDATISPLFLGAVRFSLGSDGSTLPEIILDIERQLVGIPAAAALMKEKLLAAGYVDSHAPAYLRTFEFKEARVYAVTEGFPRLTTGQVPDGVFRATYEINLDHAKDYLSNLPSALQNLGVLQ